MKYPRIGAYYPVGKQFHAVYVGSRPQYKGKTALVAQGPGASYVVQFDDIGTGFGHGWHRFRKSDWKTL